MGYTRVRQIQKVIGFDRCVEVNARLVSILGNGFPCSLVHVHESEFIISIYIFTLK